MLLPALNQNHSNSSSSTPIKKFPTTKCPISPLKAIWEILLSVQFFKYIICFYTFKVNFPLNFGFKFANTDRFFDEFRKDIKYRRGSGLQVLRE